jgi:arsenate reductase
MVNLNGVLIFIVFIKSKLKIVTYSFNIKMENINILVICTGNSCRSQIAEGYLRYFSKQLKINTNVYSAGIRAEGINKKAIEIMSKDGIDISNHTSNTLEEYTNTEISHVITVCDHANESCPSIFKESKSHPSKFL